MSRVMRPFFLVFLAAAGLGMAPADEGPSRSLSNLALDRAHPFLACTTEELGRLREAFRTPGNRQDLLRQTVRSADRILSQPLEFPPRGGQHNQWYQCDKCQTALETIDDTHHKCPVCGKVYSGPPYDDVLFKNRHGANLGNMTVCAWAYALTGETKYAEYSRKVLVGYGQRYLKYPYHSNARGNPLWHMVSGGHLYEQTLSEASVMAQHIGPAYDLVHDSGVLSEEDHTTIREGLILPLLKNIRKNRYLVDNWQCWHNAAMVWGGALLRDPAWIREALHDGRNGFFAHMRTCVTGDGMWFERTWGYHFYALTALVNIAEPLRRMGVDLWRDPALKNMFVLPASFVMPDGYLPRFGDDVRTSLKGHAGLFEAAYHAWRDDVTLSVLPPGPTWESLLYGRTASAGTAAPRLESVCFEKSGYALLRSGGAVSPAAVLTFGPYGGYHDHLDKLSFVFYGFGKELGVDPGRAESQAYRLPIHQDWYKATISHNTVVVNRRPQKPASGALEFFAREGNYSATAASCREACPGVVHRRLLFLSPGYLLVADELGSEEEITADWLYHNRGETAESADARAGTDLKALGPGYSYIGDARSGDTDGTVRAAFPSGDTTVRLTMAAEPGTRVTAGDGPGSSVRERIPLVMITRTGRAIRFVSVLEPHGKGQEPDVVSVETLPEDRALVVRVNRKDGQDFIRFGPEGFSAVVGNRTVLVWKRPGGK